MCSRQKSPCDLFSCWWDMFTCFMPGGSVWSCHPEDRIENLERLKKYFEEQLADLDQRIEKMKQEAES